MSGVVMLALQCALVALLLMLQNMRDRRRHRAIGAILAACPVSWRDSVFLDVRAPFFSRSVKAMLDVSDCEPDEFWTAMARLTAGLPPRVKLIPGSRFDPTLTVAVSARMRDGSSLLPFTVATGLPSSIR